MTTPIFTTTGGTGKDGVISARTGAKNTLLRYATGAPNVGNRQLTQDLDASTTTTTVEVGSTVPFLWIDAMTSGGMYQDNPFQNFMPVSGVVASGNPVGWALMPPYYTAGMINQTMAKRPTWRTQLINGFPALNFSAASDHNLKVIMASGSRNSFANLSTFDAFFVYRGTIYDSTPQTLLCVAGYDDAQNQGYLLLALNDTSEVAINYYMVGGISNGSTQITCTTTDAALVNATPYIFNFRDTANGKEIFVNGVQKTLDIDTASGLNNMLDKAWMITLGATNFPDVSPAAFDTQANGLTGRLGEFRMYPGLTSTQRATITSELASKWGITI